MNFMHCLLIFFHLWGLLAPKPLGVFRYRLLSLKPSDFCTSIENLPRNFENNLEISEIQCNFVFDMSISMYDLKVIITDGVFCI